VAFNGANGSFPSSLVQATDGNFYGTTDSGEGNLLYGTVFRTSPSGTLTTLYSFCPSPPNCTDGSSPEGGLLQASDGNFYGTTAQDGTGGNAGTVFKITGSGTLNTIYSFCSQSGCADGALPVGGLLQATDGSFYGATDTEGIHNGGTLFNITPSGTLTTIYSFCSQPGCTDGANANGSMVQGTDGSIYGTTNAGGLSYIYGTVFKITTTGIFTTLYNFCSQPNCTDGANPNGGLIQAVDGNFYGTTSAGGTFGGGTVFKISPGGSLTTLHNFCFPPNCPDGSGPTTGLVQATDGNFYGMTRIGGPQNDGVIFQVTPGGSLTMLHSFNGSDGEQGGWLLQAVDGNFYGTTTSGGPYPGDGTAFLLSTGLAPFAETQPTSGNVGAPVVILGTGLTGATNVTFNGTAATFNVISPSEITTTVPAGATTGSVQVTAPGGPLTSNTVFQVTGPLQFIPLPNGPCRLLDTRNGSPIPGGYQYPPTSFTIQNLNANGPCGSLIPTNAAAYSVNVTVVPHGPLGYLTIWPEGEIQPYVSTMNSYDGRVKANAAIVPAGNNAVSIYVTNTTDVVLDIDGYFAAPGSGSYQFYPLTPCRIIDTRNGQDEGTLQAGQERDYALPTYNSDCTIPSSATAYSLNVTVLPTQGTLGYLTVWPQGEPQPYVSTLNDPTGTVVANAAIVPAGSNQTTAFYPYNNDTDLLVDVNGYFAPVGSGGLSFYPATPCRAFDTRTIGNGQPFQGTWPGGINVTGSSCAPPASAQAFVLNATVVPSGLLGYLTLWPDGGLQPLVSTLNAYDGAVTSNLAIVPSNVSGYQGSINAYADGLTQLILDISGYFAP
jgi:uncharacterized repeat protein (TIGR03803 family)